MPLLPGPMLPRGARSDVGFFRFLVGNFGGRRSAETVNEALETDLRSTPVAVVFLQEAPADFVLPGFDRSGDVDASGIAVYARATSVLSVDVMREDVIRDGTANQRGRQVECFTMEQVCRVNLARPVATLASVVVANVHFHHCTAKR